jgi:phosphopantetheinyl transferase
MAQKATIPREIQWLLGRAAAKDALRSHFHERASRWFAPAELMIGSDASGRPLLRGGWRTDLPGRPEISISHTDGLAVGAAAEDGARIGVDAEKIRPPSQDLLDAAFSEADLARLPPEARDSDELRAEWVFRLWCAKEAVGKALGSGVSLDPRQFAVVGVDPGRGLVAIRPQSGADAVALTFRRGSHVLAVAVLAAAR